MDQRVPLHQEGRDRQLSPATRRRSLQRCGGALLLAAALAACSPVPPRPAALHEGASQELAATPFFPQEAHECGPAALAMLLGAAGREATPDALAPYLIVPDRKGSLQPELLAHARQQGFIAMAVAPKLEALVAELRAGRPVLVLQNNGLSWYTVWHYAVVIGYDPVHDTVVLRSGLTERLVLPRKTFERTWGRAERWASSCWRRASCPRRAKRAITRARSPPSSRSRPRRGRPRAPGRRGAGAGRTAGSSRSGSATDATRMALCRRRWRPSRARPRSHRSSRRPGTTSRWPTWMRAAGRTRWPRRSAPRR
jgi:hypothetical protein